MHDKFPSNTSLWLVLRKFEEGVAGGPSAQKLNLTQRGVPSTDSGSGRLNYEQPCLNIMGRELGSFTDLQKTLAQLGFNNGSVLLRLTFKNEGQAMEEAMALISSYFDSVHPTSSPQTPVAASTASAHGAHASAGADMTSVPDASAENAAAPSEDQAHPEPSEDTVMSPAPPLETSTETPVHENPDDVIASSSTTAVPSTESQFPSLSQDQSSTTTTTTTTNTPQSPTSSSQPTITVYAAPTGTTPAAALQPHNEADFAPSVEHAHAHQAVLNRAAQNKRLLSDRELDAAAESKKQALSNIHNIVIRVRLPDQMMFDADMNQQDTVAALYKIVRDQLADSTQAFQLRWTNAKGRTETLDPDSNARLIGDLGMRGKVLVTMVWDASVHVAIRQQPVLADKLRAHAKELQVQMDVPQVEQEKDTKTEKKEEPKKKGGSKGDKEARLMKLMGFGRK